MCKASETSPNARAIALDPWRAVTDRDLEDIRRVAWRMAGRAEDGEDLAQEICVEILQRPLIRRDGSIGWLQLLARHAIGRLRRREVDRRNRERSAVTPEIQSSTLESLERNETRTRIAQLVAGLGEPYRSNLHMRYFDGLSVAEIAERTGRSRATVRSQIKRGLDRLRRRRDALLR